MNAVRKPKGANDSEAVRTTNWRLPRRCSTTGSENRQRMLPERSRDAGSDRWNSDDALCLGEFSPATCHRERQTRRPKICRRSTSTRRRSSPERSAEHSGRDTRCFLSCDRRSGHRPEICVPSQFSLPRSIRCRIHSLAKIIHNCWSRPTPPIVKSFGADGEAASVPVRSLLASAPPILQEAPGVTESN